MRIYGHRLTILNVVGDVYRPEIIIVSVLICPIRIIEILEKKSLDGHKGWIWTDIQTTVWGEEAWWRCRWPSIPASYNAYNIVKF